MNLHRWQRSIPMIGYRAGRRRPAAARRLRPGVEPMESRAMLSTITEFPVGPGAHLGGIAAGADGNLWFTDVANNVIGTIGPITRAVAEVPIPTAGAEPEGIVAGPDGRLWFTEASADKIGSVNPATHVVSEFPVPTPKANPDEIAAGPDGRLWFTELFADKIGSIDPISHAFVEVSLPAGSAPLGIAAGPDGNVWFTDGDNFTSKIGMLNPATLAVTEFPIPTAPSNLYAIAAGSDGQLWFTDSDSGEIGSIDPKTFVMAETGLPAVNSIPTAIVAGPDGQLWFTELTGARIGSIDPGTRRITETAVPTAGAMPESIAVGSDGNLWFADLGRHDAGVLSPTPLPTFTAPPARITPHGAFGLTVTVVDGSGQTDAQYSGDVGLKIVSSAGDRFEGAASDGTVRAVAHNGVAVFSGLVIDGPSDAHDIQLGAFTILPATTTTYAPVTVALPTIDNQQTVFTSIHRVSHLSRLWLEFDTAMDPASASDPANYSLVQFRRHGRRLVARPVAFRVAYVAAMQRATLTLVGRPKFARGGELVVRASQPGGLVDASGLPLDAGGQGVPGDDGTFAIAPKGKGISRSAGPPSKKIKGA